METAEQKAFVAWFRSEWPEHARALRVSLRGLNFGSGPRAARMVNHIKSQGSVDGEADIAILLPRNGHGALVIEHKGAGQSHPLSSEQQAYLDYHNAHGNCAISTRGLDALKAAVVAYMAGVPVTAGSLV